MTASSADSRAYIGAQKSCIGLGVASIWEWTAERIRALGAVTDLLTAAAIFGISRTAAYELARTNRFPVPVIRAGSRYRIPVAPILTALRIPPSPKPGADDLIVRPERAWITTTRSEATTAVDTATVFDRRSHRR